MKSALILGSGYAGKELADRISTEVDRVYETSRSQGGVRFDLNCESTWKNLPTVDGTFWMFPPVPTALVRLFLTRHCSQLGRLIVVGTTSSYIVSRPDEDVTEESASSPSDVRTQGEDELRLRGATIVRSSGIYGQGRNPIDWLKAGKISNLSKFVNFIHVKDLAEILWAAMRKGQETRIYIASDNRPMKWTDLCGHWEKEFQLKVSSAKTASSAERMSKRVNSSRTLKELEIQLKYPCVLDGVRDLMGA
jgi:nucleoside-diphosphate-sugar epimerase